MIYTAITSTGIETLHSRSLDGAVRRIAAASGVPYEELHTEQHSSTSWRVLRTSRGEHMVGWIEGEEP